MKRFKRMLGMCLALLMLFEVFGAAVPSLRGVFAPVAYASNLKPLFTETDSYKDYEALYAAKNVTAGQSLEVVDIPYIPGDFSSCDYWNKPNGLQYDDEWFSTVGKARDAYWKESINHEKSLNEYIFRAFLGLGYERIRLAGDLTLWHNKEDGNMNYRELKSNKLVRFLYELKQSGKVTNAQWTKIVEACALAFFSRPFCEYARDHWSWSASAKQQLQNDPMLIVNDFADRAANNRKYPNDEYILICPDPSVKNDVSKWDKYPCKDGYPIKIKHDVFLDLNGYNVNGYENGWNDQHTLFLIEGQGTSKTTPSTFIIDDRSTDKTGEVKFRGEILEPGDDLNAYSRRDLFEVGRNGYLYIFGGSYAAGNMDRTNTETEADKFFRVVGNILKNIIPVTNAGVQLVAGSMTGNTSQIITSSLSLIGATADAVNDFRSDASADAATAPVTKGPDGKNVEVDKSDLEGKNRGTADKTTAEQNAALQAKGGNATDTQAQPGSGASMVLSQKGSFKVSTQEAYIYSREYIENPAAHADEFVAKLKLNDEVYVLNQYNADWYQVRWNDKDTFISTKSVVRQTGFFTVIEDGAIVRDKAGTDGRQLTTLSKGTTVNVTGEENGYYVYQYKSDIKGYVWKASLKALQPDSLKDIANRQAQSVVDEWNKLKTTAEPKLEKVANLVAKYITPKPREDKWWVVNHGTVFKVKEDGKVIVFAGTFVGFGQNEDTREAVITNQNGEVYIYGGTFEGHAGADIAHREQNAGVNTKFFVRGGTYLCSSVDNLRGLKRSDDKKNVVPGTRGCINFSKKDYGADMIADGRIQICEISGVGDLVYKDVSTAGVEYQLYCDEADLPAMTYATVSYRDSEYMSRTFSLRGAGEHDSYIDKYNYLEFGANDGTAYIAPVLNGSNALPTDADYGETKSFWYYSFPWSTFLKNFRYYQKNSAFSTGWYNYNYISGSKAYKYELYVVDPVSLENVGDPVAVKTVSTTDVVTGQLYLRPSTEYNNKLSNGFYLYDNWIPGCMYRVKLTITEFVDVGRPDQNSRKTTAYRQVYSAASSTSLLILCAEDRYAAFTPIKFTDTNLGVGDTAEVDFYNARVGRVDVYGEKIYAVNYDWRVMTGSSPNLDNDLPLVITNRKKVGGGGASVKIYGHPYDQREVDTMILEEGYPMGFLGAFNQTTKLPESRYPYWSSTDRLVIPDYVPDPDDPTQNYKDANGNAVALAGKQIYCRVTYGLCSYRWARAIKDLPVLDMAFHQEYNEADFCTPRDVLYFDTVPVTVKSEPQGAKLKADSDILDNSKPGGNIITVSRGGSCTLYANEPITKESLMPNDIEELQHMTVYSGAVSCRDWLYKFYTADVPIVQVAGKEQRNTLINELKESGGSARIINISNLSWKKWDETQKTWVFVNECDALTLTDLQQGGVYKCERKIEQAVVIDGRPITRGDIWFFVNPQMSEMQIQLAKRITLVKSKTQNIAQTEVRVLDKPMNLGFTQLDAVGQPNTGSENGTLQQDHWFYDTYTGTLKLQGFTNDGQFYQLNGIAGVIEAGCDLTIDLRGANVINLDCSKLPADVQEIVLIKANSLTFTGEGSLTVNVNAAAGTLKKLTFLRADDVNMFAKGKVSLKLDNADFPNNITVRYTHTDKLLDGFGTLSASVKTLPVAANAASCAYIAPLNGDAAEVEVMNSDTRGLSVYEGASESAASIVTETEAKLIERLQSPLNVNYRAAEITVAHKHTWTAETIYASATLTSTGIARITCTGCGEHKDTVIPIFGVYGALAEATADGEVTLTWDPTLEASSYEVFRYSDTVQDFVQLGTVESSAADIYTYVDQDLVAGVKYIYKIRAVRTGDRPLTSAFCDEVSATAYVTPARPVGVKAAPTGDGKITVSWTASKYATGYEIYRYEDEEMILAGTVAANSDNPTQFEDSGLVAGSTYGYTVMAVLTLENEAKITSGHSEKVTAKAYALQKPDNVEAAVPTSLEGVTISWNMVPNATGYVIYRSPKDANNYQQIGTVDAIAGNDTYTYTDTGVESSTAYNYKVAAIMKVDGGVVISDLSAPVAVTTPANMVVGYSVTVTGGTADVVKAKKGDTVTITASVPESKEFDRWEVVKGNITLADASKATTTFMMGEEDVEVKAVFKDIFHTVTVTNGTANTDNAVRGTTVIITANAAPSGKAFDKWEIVKGGVTLVDVTSTVTTFVMGDLDVEVKATYKDLPVSEHSVTVTNGVASATSAANGATVIITAAAAPEGKAFDKWEVVKGGITLADATANVTTFVMGDLDVEVKAAYKDLPSEKHSVTVTSGTADKSTAAKGETVTVTASAAPEGKAFDKWEVVKGNITLADVTSTVTTFVMGDLNVEVKAVYRDIGSSGEEGLFGDIDGDGNITAADARLALRMSVDIMHDDGIPFTDKQITAADVDRDGRVTGADARLLLRKAVGLEVLSEGWAGPV
ncbi:MAG: SH3 domain-containing protein [Clostridia bacterium]|nr:SH3 domain-containing protein [Clostridia bacterium]